MGPIDETQERYTLDCYFRSVSLCHESHSIDFVCNLDNIWRQYWYDERLKFNQSYLINELAMNWQFLEKIWRPDTFFLNGKDSYLHKIAVPNRSIINSISLFNFYKWSRFIRIAPDGRISFSQRLTISAKCKMNLQKFPLDSQVCPLQIGSFGHPSTDIIYKWADKPLRYLLAGIQQTTTNSASHLISSTI